MSRRRAAVIAAVCLLCASLLVGVAGAQSARTGGTVTVPAGETHEGDLEATGGEVVIEGTVDGDLTATGGEVRIPGNVTGEATATGGTVSVGGEIGDGLTATGGEVRIGEAASVGGTLEAVGGTVSLNGTVEGDADLEGETVTVGETASIGGDLAYAADAVDIADGAEIGGDVTEREGEAAPFDDISLPDLPGPASAVLAGLYLFAANFVLGAVFLVAAPAFSDRVAEGGADRPLASGGVGILTVIASPFVLLALFLSIVGIPLAFFASYGVVFLFWAGVVYGAYLVGTVGVSRLGVGGRWAALALGTALVGAAAAVPYAGWIIVVVTLLGTGALVRALYGRRFGDEGGRGPDEGIEGAVPYPAVESTE